MTSTAIGNNSASLAADFGDMRAEFGALVSACWRLRLEPAGQDSAHRKRPGALAQRHGHQQYPGFGGWARRVCISAQPARSYSRATSTPTIAASHCSSIPLSRRLEKLLATFDHYIIMDDVEVANISDKHDGDRNRRAKSARRAAGRGIEFPELGHCNLWI